VKTPEISQKYRKFPKSNFDNILNPTQVSKEPSIVTGLVPGVNPTIASYNASVVNSYNATGSLARFENKFFTLL
jgi:hypothetical protein